MSELVVAGIVFCFIMVAISFFSESVRHVTGKTPNWYIDGHNDSVRTVIKKPAAPPPPPPPPTKGVKHA